MGALWIEVFFSTISLIYSLDYVVGCFRAQWSSVRSKLDFGSLESMEIYMWAFGPKAAAVAAAQHRYCVSP